MALKHFFLTIPLASLILTVTVYFVLPMTGAQYQWYELFLIMTSVNVVVTVIALLLIPDGKGRRRSS